jgi:signal transduction histidine kinase
MAATMRRASSGARPATLGWWAAALGFGLFSILIARAHPGATFGGRSSTAALVELAAGSAMIGAGCYVWWRRQERRSGILLTAVGVTWFFAEWNNPGITVEAAFTFGIVAAALATAVVAHAALTYPTGRVSSRLERVAIALAYVDAALVLGFMPALFFDPRRQGCSLCPHNLLLVDSDPRLFGFLSRAGIWLGVAWTIAIATLCVWRVARSSPPLRRLRAPVLAGGAVYVVLVFCDLVHSLQQGWLGTDPFEYRLWLGEAMALLAMAAGVAWSWFRARKTRSAVASLVVELGASPPSGGLRDLLARSLGDQDVEVAYPLPEPERWVDVTGSIVEPAADDDRALTPLTRGGETVALVLHRRGLLDDPSFVEELVAATRLSLENERLQAQVLAKLEDLQASRARIVAASDEERRRLERDLHDGAQQRLVGLALAIRLARTQLRADPDSNAEALLDRADHALRVAIDELRELAHGIYPAVLTEEGLAAAVEALRERAAIPVEISQVPEGRFPGAVEGAAYFLIAEALGPIAAFTAANAASVDVRRDRDRLVVEVIEDRADHPDPGSDPTLIHLADRIGALDGLVSVRHTPDGSIRIRAEIPCES